MVQNTYSLEGFDLCVGTRKGCGGVGKVQSHDLSHHTLEWGT